ncbi:MAG: response regulator [Hyphomonadaceae bacterium]|nr:response regulator [Hyphomonadaceae bacterium]
MTPLDLVAIVEDDPEIRDLAVALFRREGFEAAPCENARALDALLARTRPALIVMDVMMPGEDGLSVCRRLAANNGPPVILVTARGEDIDRIIGLEIGADDYLPKPFNPRELIARARSVLRRARAPADSASRQLISADAEIYSFEGWNLDAASRSFTNPGGEAIELSAGEYDLLMAFVKHPQRVLSRDFLMDWTKGREATAFDRSVDVMMSRLRRKLGDDSAAPRFIRTVRNGGYLFAVAVSRS